MSMKRWMGLALVLAVALAGCKKKEETQPAAQPTAQAQPAQPGAPALPEPAAQPERTATGTAGAQPTATGTTPAPSAAETAEVLKALDGSVDKLSEGFGGALGGLMAKRASATPSGTTEPGAAEENEPPPPIQRIQIHVDLAAVKASPLGGLVEAAMAMIKSEADEEAACLVDLLGKVSSGFADITMGPDGEPSSFLASIKSTATKDEVVNCMKGMADEDETFVEVPVGNKTGWTMREGDEPVKVVMVEATPGNFLFGMPATLETTLGSGADPETDAAFQALTAPLGPSFARMTILFKPEFAQLAETVAADAPPQAQCLRNVFGRTKGASMGIRLTPDFSLAFAVQNASATEAAETQACLNGLWQMFKPALLQEVGEADAAQMQQLVGMTPAQFLDLIKIEATAEFAKVSLSLPGDFLAKVAQVVAAMAGSMGPGGPGATL